MSLRRDPYSIFNESETSAEVFEDSEEVVEVAEELADTMESIPYDTDASTLTDDPIPEITAEMVNMVQLESNRFTRRARRPKYVLEYSLLRAYMEAEGEEDAGEAVEDIADANQPEPTDDNPAPVEISAADVVVVAPSDEEVKEIVDSAVQEAKTGKPGFASKKMKQLKDDIEALKDKGAKVIKRKKSKKSKK